MRFRPRPLRTALAVTGTVALAAGLSTQALAEPAAATETVSHEVFSPDGTITRQDVTVEINDTPAPASTVAEAVVTPIIENGPSEEKFDIVVVGDGYTADELGTYDSHVRSKIDELFAVEPFTSYQSQFNVWKVDVVSNESGVDNDPLGTLRDTALDMYFYCGDLDRLLCVNETKANQYAAEAPDVDQVIALANSTTYGGAGGGVATSSGGHPDAGQIVVHELGHSIGGLADEYTYGSGDLYTGPEVPESNVSIYDRATQEAQQIKWHAWMGQESPDGGIVDTYDGGRYYESGIFRPTDNSIMRSLGREFNLPGREAMVAAFHNEAAVASTPYATADVVTLGTELSVTLPDLPSERSVTWSVDGRAVTGSSGETAFDTTGLEPGAVVTVTVVDETDWVIDRQLRDELLTITFTWRLG